MMLYAVYAVGIADRTIACASARLFVATLHCSLYFVFHILLLPAMRVPLCEFRYASSAMRVSRRALLVAQSIIVGFASRQARCGGAV